MNITTQVELANRICQHFGDQSFATKTMMLVGAADCSTREAMHIMRAAEVAHDDNIKRAEQPVVDWAPTDKERFEVEALHNMAPEHTNAWRGENK